MESPRSLISFFELLGAYIEVILRNPNRLCNNDLLWIAIPIVADNLRGDFIHRKHYATAIPTSWMLRELEARNLTNNLAIAPKRLKGFRRTAYACGYDQ